MALDFNQRSFTKTVDQAAIDEIDEDDYCEDEQQNHNELLHLLISILKLKVKLPYLNLHPRKNHLSLLEMRY